MSVEHFFELFGYLENTYVFGIVSKDARGIKGDCCEWAHAKKVKRYSTAIRQLQADGLAFMPMVWSQEGRPHPAAERVLAYAAQLAARGRPGLQPKQFVKRWRREIVIELQRSLARMIMVCEPAQGRRADFFLGGRLDVECA